MELASLIVVLAVALAVIFFIGNAVRVIANSELAWSSGSVSSGTLEPGPHLVVPLFDKVRYNMDMRENVVPFPPQGVITEDNLMVNIDSVIYFQIIDPVRAAYEAQDYIKAIEQLTMTTLRNIIGGLDLEEALTSREEINQKLRVVLDEATGKWGIKVNRVELRAIDPLPPSGTRWKRVLGRSGTSGHRSCSPRANGSRRFCPRAVRRSPRSCGRRATARLPYCEPRPIGRLRCSAPRARRRRSPRSSTPSMPVSPTRRCWPTSTCRCCRRSLAATPTRCGWCPAS